MSEIRTEEGVPPGWTKLLKKRTGGNTAGVFDVYMLSPSGQKFRSRKDLQTYFDRTGESRFSVDDFDFSKSKSVVFGASAAEKHVKTPTPAKRGRAKRTAIVNLDSDDDDPKPSKKRGRRSNATNGEVAPETFLLEKYSHDPWKFIMAAFWLERNGKKEDEPLRETVKEFFDVFPDAKTLHRDRWLGVLEFLNYKRRGDEKFAQLLTRYTYEFTFNDGKEEPHRLYGVSAFMLCCYRIFVLRDLTAPTSYGPDLMAYKRRVKRAMKSGRR